MLRLLLIAAIVTLTLQSPAWAQSEEKPKWLRLPDLPNELGVAGPLVGVSGDWLVAAGGANFPTPVWENSKQWVREIYGLQKLGEPAWRLLGTLPKPLAYAACASTSRGIVIAGGNDSHQVFDQCWLLSVEHDSVKLTSLPSLPQPCVYGQACVIHDVVYVIGGQSNVNLASALSNLWALDFSKFGQADWAWQQLSACPGPPRAFNLTMANNNSLHPSLYVIGGRYEQNGQVQFLSDVWECQLGLQPKWIKRDSTPRPITAGTGFVFKGNLWLISGDDGRLFSKTDELRDKHPSFPKQVFRFDLRGNNWSTSESPSNQVTTSCVPFRDGWALVSGEIRPRVRTPQVWYVGF